MIIICDMLPHRGFSQTFGLLAMRGSRCFRFPFSAPPRESRSIPSQAQPAKWRRRKVLCIDYRVPPLYPHFNILILCRILSAYRITDAPSHERLPDRRHRNLKASEVRARTASSSFRYRVSFDTVCPSGLGVRGGPEATHPGGSPRARWAPSRGAQRAGPERGRRHDGYPAAHRRHRRERRGAQTAFRRLDEKDKPPFSATREMCFLARTRLRCKTEPSPSLARRRERRRARGFPHRLCPPPCGRSPVEGQRSLQCLHKTHRSQYQTDFEPWKAVIGQRKKDGVIKHHRDPTPRKHPNNSV